MAVQMLWPEVAIVILNWNNAPDTIACLESVAHLDYPNTRILVVDNGSTDGSADRIRQAHPSIPVLETGQNLGYAEGNNVGIAVALEQKAPYICILNNDIALRPDFLTQLVAEAEADTSIGIVGPKITSGIRRI
jgi:GT2 family glycosyltransferase